MKSHRISPAVAPPARKATRHLVESSPVKTPAPTSQFSPQHLTLQAVTITAVIKKIMATTGWQHGGIND